MAVPVVFCDSGAFSPAIQRLHHAGKIVAKQGLYEARSRKADIARPSMWTFDNPHITFDMTEVTFGDTYSEKHADIVRIVGSDPRTAKDALQLDSAFITGVDAFATSDKRDIVSHRSELEPLLGFRIFHIPDEEAVLLEWLDGRSGDRV